MSGGPANGTVYLVAGVRFDVGLTLLLLAGEPGWWDADEFRPLIPASQIAEEARAHE